MLLGKRKAGAPYLLCCSVVNRRGTTRLSGASSLVNLSPHLYLAFVSNAKP